MPRMVDYYFSMASPFAYLGHAPFMEIVARHGLKLRYRPVFLGQVFAETGGLPLPKRHPARQRYRLVDLQRWRDRRGVWFNIRPRYWPFDVNLADRFVIAIVTASLDPDAFMRAAFAGVWEGELDLADATTLLKLAAEAGLDGAGLLEAARDPASEAIYEQNFHDAIAADVFGSPSYVLDGEVFWGQDRLDLLDDALSTGRHPYGPLG
jgi:2-hydroxychromene-2-carboxylate isomerase